jgi:hypothetical protein
MSHSRDDTSFAVRVSPRGLQPHSSLTGIAIERGKFTPINYSINIRKRALSTD